MALADVNESILSKYLLESTLIFVLVNFTDVLLENLKGLCTVAMKVARCPTSSELITPGDRNRVANFDLVIKARGEPWRVKLFRLSDWPQDGEVSS